MAAPSAPTRHRAAAPPPDACRRPFRRRPRRRRPPPRPSPPPRAAARGAARTGSTLGSDGTRGRVVDRAHACGRRACADGRRQGRRAGGQRPRAGAPDLCGGREGRSRGATRTIASSDSRRPPAAWKRRRHSSEAPSQRPTPRAETRKPAHAPPRKAGVVPNRPRAEPRHRRRRLRLTPLPPPSRPRPSRRRAPAQPTAQEAVGGDVAPLHRPRSNNATSRRSRRCGPG